jgi:nucleoside-triphosphatase THEP1
VDAKNILVTGNPGCGKSTLIERVVLQLKRPVMGFITREIREKGKRVGFSIDTFDGKKGVLAHVAHPKSGPRVGKYGVDLQTIDKIVVGSLKGPTSPDVLVVIDEIGKMECFSFLFKKTVVDLLDSPLPVFGSISQKGDAFIRNIKARSDVSTITVTAANRDALLASLVRSLQK